MSNNCIPHSSPRVFKHLRLLHKKPITLFKSTLSLPNIQAWECVTSHCRRLGGQLWLPMMATAAKLELELTSNSQQTSAGSLHQMFLLKSHILNMCGLHSILASQVQKLTKTDKNGQNMTIGEAGAKLGRCVGRVSCAVGASPLMRGKAH